MPTERLNQALRETNVAGVEKDFPEVLARMFDLPVPVMARVLYAIETIKDPVTWRLGDDRAAALIPDADLRDAIRKQANAGALRVHLRRLQLQGQRVEVRTRALVPADNPSRICEGCPHAMTCIPEGLSTPEHCLETLEAPSKVYVDKWQAVSLIKVTPDGRVVVRARQPIGDHDLPVEAVEF